LKKQTGFLDVLRHHHPSIYIASWTVWLSELFPELLYPFLVLSDPVNLLYDNYLAKLAKAYVGQHTTYHNDSFAQNMLILLQKQIFILLDTFIF